MKRFLTAIVLIPLVLLVLFKAPMWLFTLVVGIVAMGAAWEYLGLVSRYDLQPFKEITLAFVALIFFTASLSSVPGLEYSASKWGVFAMQQLPSLLMLCVPLTIFAIAMNRGEFRTTVPAAAMTSLAIPYIVWTLLALVIIRQRRDGVVLILFLFVCVWIGDIFAYYVGKAIGKRKLAPRVSPGKTWEGAIASVVGAVFIGHILFVHQQDILTVVNGPQQGWLVPSTRWGVAPWTLPELKFVGAILAVLINIAAQIGDLVESIIKRGAGVKDSGSLLPGHGGILDRIDALLFAIPVLYIYAMMNPEVSFYTPFIQK